MFVLTEMKDTIKIPPWLFHAKLNDAIVETLNKKFANKVIFKLGLCIALWDVTKVGDSFILPGDGATYTSVTFRFVVFRPFMDEILIGKIKSSGPEGINVSLGYFEDILIPADSMPEPSKFEEEEQLWYWDFQTEGGESHKLFLDINEEIRFKVVDELFVDTTPSGPTTGDGTDKVESEKKAPYSLIASIREQGLGLISWWSNT